MQRSETLELCTEGSDRVLRLFMRPRPGRRRMVLAGLLVVGVMPILAATGAGNWVNSSLKLDALHDVAYHQQFLLLLPFFGWFIRHYLDGLAPALAHLRADGVVVTSDERQRQFVADANLLFRQRWVTLIPWAIGGAVSLISAATYWFAGLNTWSSPVTGAWHDPVVWLSFAPVFALYYLMAALVVRMAVVSKVIQLFLRMGVRSHALHPDNCGGLAPLGAFSLRITTAAVVTGVAALVGVWANLTYYELAPFSPVNVGILAGYVLGLSVAFFMPLLPARTEMLQIKNRTLLGISREVRNQLDHAVQTVQATTGAHIDMERIEALQKLYELASRMPVYPFNFKNVAGFASSILWPIVLLILGQVVSRL